MRINVEKVKRFVGETQKALRTLKEFAALDKEEILKDTGKLERIKYNFIIAIQSVIDICNHIVAKKGGRPPEDYADCFKILGEMGIIEQDFSHKLSQMAKFRNLLIHLYWEVDDVQVLNVLKEELGDFDKFLEVIAKLMASELGLRSPLP